MYGKIKELRK